MGLVKDLFNSHVNKMKEQAKAIIVMEHPGEKGYFREHFINEVIAEMLPVHLGAGSGFFVVKQQNGTEIRSNQCDVIIYDKRILPPFVANTKTSMYPIQSVIAIIEVKTGIRWSGEWYKILDKMLATWYLFETFEDELEWYNKRNRRYTVNRKYKPYLLIFSYNMNKRGNKISNDWSKLYNERTADRLLPKFMGGYCILGKGSNLNLKEPPKFVPSDRSDESERFFCITIDNIIRLAEYRYEQIMFKTPRKVLQTDIWGKYIRV